MRAGFRASPDELLFIPLGGADEIGMNLNLYHYAGSWLMVDLGISFGDESVPGVEVVMPDPGFIEERRDSLAGLVLTHGHEDHIGAIPWLWERLGCPIYATPFTASLVRRKLEDAGLAGRAQLVELLPGASVTLGPFDIGLIGLTHSIPEAQAVTIRCGAGLVVHTGDWKFDRDPGIGAVSDMAALEAAAHHGVLALVGDSTNADVPGSSGSEGDLPEEFVRVFRECPQRIAVTCFASNLARLRTVALAAERVGRHTALVGRSLVRMNEVARQHGFLDDLPPFLGEAEVVHIPRDRLVMLCTGSQGEPRAALSRIAAGSHPVVDLEPGDAVIYSSREIPGNEKAIGRVQNRLTARGVRVITDRDRPVHVSGHPARDDLARIYRIVRPQIAVPVHGDSRRLAAHAEVARACQVPEVLVPENGTVFRLAPGPAQAVGKVETSALFVDGQSLRQVNGTVIRDRHRMLLNGSVSATLVLNRRGFCHLDPIVTVAGLCDDRESDALGDDLSEYVRDMVDDLPPRERMSDLSVESAAARVLRRRLRRRFGKRPMIAVHVARI